jgi:WD40 repeat protein
LIFLDAYVADPELVGDDCTVRVYASDGRAEVATLKHEWPVACMAWMDGNAGLMTIGTNGIVSKWTSLTVCEFEQRI